jgi:pimeloyl-ACP methyl ester carboxylesterase
MEYMITLRNSDGSDGVAAPRYIGFDDDIRPEVSFDSTDKWVSSLVATFPLQPPDRVGRIARQGDILFLVHGFNVSHDDAKKFHLKCVTGLQGQGWFGRVVSYDWPSDGLVFAYVDDRFNARAAASTLITGAIALLEAAQLNQCTINVHVLAHSMGAFVLQQAFTWSYQDVPPDWKVGQLMFAAADVDYTVFEHGSPSATAFVNHAGRLTAYCNGYDKALLVSNAKRLDLAPRMGRVGLPDSAPPMMCEVNCSALFEEFAPDLGDELSPVTTHSFYFDRPEFWRDVVLTLGGGIDRGSFKTRDPDPENLLPNRFELKPGGISNKDYRMALLQAKTSDSIRI